MFGLSTELIIKGKLSTIKRFEYSNLFMGTNINLADKTNIEELELVHT